MANIISIINQPSADSLMCILDLAKLLCQIGKSVCIVGDNAYQQLLFNYSLRFVELKALIFMTISIKYKLNRSSYTMDTTNRHHNISYWLSKICFRLNHSVIMYNT